MSGHASGRVVVSRGARAAEDALLADLAGLSCEVRGDPSLLSRTVLVVVSSGPLRKRLAARIAARLPEAALGVRVQTLWSVAREVLERAGRPVPSGADLFEILVRREAARQDALSCHLGQLEDGFGLVASTVRDLSNACFEPEMLPELERLLASSGEDEGAKRARALLAIAAGAARGMRELGVGRIGEVLAAATSALREKEAALLPARAVLVHGFADATGRATEFLVALQEALGASVHVDLPPDPAGGADPVDWAYPRRFLHRLSPAPEREERASTRETPGIDWFDASGAEEEVRLLADQVRDLLDSGVPPEEIGVVARSLEGCAVHIRTRFGELGIPHGGGLAPAGLVPGRRRLDAGLELLARGDAVAVDRWIDALGPNPASEDLRLAFRSLGAARLSDAADLDPEAILAGRVDYPLPVRRGFVARPEAPEEERSQAARRELSGASLTGAILAARGLSFAWRDRPARGLAPALAAWVRGILTEHLGWTAGGQEATAGALSAMDELLDDIPPGVELSVEEFLVLLLARTRELGAEPLGGRGAGVQVLAVSHARGLTFEHLFLVGLNRDVFPRVVREDPFLPDPIRARLARRLPDLPEKSRGHDEERFLFAELLSSAPHVTLSWLRADDDGRELHRSPFVERLVPRAEEEERSAPSDRLSTPRDFLCAAAVDGGRPLFALLLPLALEEAREHLSPAAREGFPGARDLAAARGRVLAEYDPAPGDSSPSPWFGLVAPALGTPDPRQGPLYVTTLERLARCPWQTLLARILRLEPARDPLASLPEIDDLLVGTTVHEALRRLVEPATGRRPEKLAAALSANPEEFRRPDRDTALRVLTAVAREKAREAGIHFTGLARALAVRARPFVERALALRNDSDRIVGCELGWHADVCSAGVRGQRLHFTADLAHYEGERLVLTDYKTGSPLTDKKKEETRRRDLERAIAEGRALQAAAYAAGARGTIGRYLYLAEGIRPDCVSLSVAQGDPEVERTFPEAVRRLVSAWEAGAFFPRLEDENGNEPRACDFCDLSEACVRRDSGARRRLRQLAAAAQGASAKEEESVPAALASLAALWFPARKTEDPE
ncbi:MAG: PD-(D/E)XK nuclease family protein [Planctomycetes bacterium]|nr:PD-(D/E)XK nuclease family protein [Planctomycetota bacterium]